jgi:RNA polymerase sigma factor (sigma-70 family)
MTTATATTTPPSATPLESRLAAIAERTGDRALQRVANGQLPFDDGPICGSVVRLDWANTCLMNLFKATGDADAFALLFELNRDDFLQTIRGRVRRRPEIDPEDVLQDAFMNIHRYPHRFQGDRARSFRCWGHAILRNMTLGSLKRRAGAPISLSCGEQSWDPEDPRVRPPEQVAGEHEDARLVDHAFLLFLALYLAQFERLSPKTQRMLTLVEIHGSSYRDTAREVGRTPASLKVAIFRARRRILDGMQDALVTLSIAPCAPRSASRRSGSSRSQPRPPRKAREGLEQPLGRVG